MMTPPPIFRSVLQARILGLLYLNPARAWSTAEILDRVRGTPATTHRELHRALDAGLVLREPVGQTFLYRAATDSPLFSPLKELLEKTVGVEPRVREALEGLPGVDAAFIHGSFARGTKIQPMSDIEVLVLGDVDPRALTKRLRDAERDIGREIDVTSYSRDEFAALARSGNSFARRIVGGPLTVLAGSRDDLLAMA